ADSKPKASPYVEAGHAAIQQRKAPEAEPTSTDRKPKPSPTLSHANAGHPAAN
ncbi:hypothetical protein RUND412_009429, partial [Rhizina undulata]